MLRRWPKFEIGGWTFGCGCLVVAVWAWALANPRAAQVFGWGEFGRFFDLQGSLAAAEYAHAGGDAYTANPLDVSRRPHLYSSWWLLIGRFVGRHHSNVIGVVLVAAVLIVSLAYFRPRNRAEALMALAVLVSPAVLLAVYRANNDLLVFIGLALVIRLLVSRDSRASLAASFLIGILTVLKYFPVAALVGLSAQDRRRTVLLGLVGFAVVLALGWPSLAPAFAVLGQHAPVTAKLQAFGAPVLERDLGDLAPSWLAWTLAGLACALGVRVARRSTEEGDRPAEPSEVAAMMSMAVGCTAFLIGSSYVYKMIFFWWTIPWLLRAGAGLEPLRLRAILAVLLLILWGDGTLTAVFNLWAPSWSNEGRRLGLEVIRFTAIGTQLVCWVFIGACVRWLAAWTVRQSRRLYAAG